MSSSKIIIILFTGTVLIVVGALFKILDFSLFTFSGSDLLIMGLLIQLTAACFVIYNYIKHYSKNKNKEINSTRDEESS